MLKTFYIVPEFNLLISFISQIQHTTYLRTMADGFHLLQNHWLGLVLPIKVLGYFSIYIIAWKLFTSMTASYVKETLDEAVSNTGVNNIQLISEHNEPC
jgi:hypothetical protein